MKSIIKTHLSGIGSYDQRLVYSDATSFVTKVLRSHTVKRANKSVSSHEGIRSSGWIHYIGQKCVRNHLQKFGIGVKTRSNTKD